MLCGMKLKAEPLTLDETRPWQSTALVINATLLVASLLNSCWCETLATCKSVGKGAQWCGPRSSVSQGLVEWIKVEGGLGGGATRRIQ